MIGTSPGRIGRVGGTALNKGVGAFFFLIAYAMGAL